MADTMLELCAVCQLPRFTVSVYFFSKKEWRETVRKYITSTKKKFLDKSLSEKSAVYATYCSIFDPEHCSFKNLPLNTRNIVSNSDIHFMPSI